MLSNNTANAVNDTKNFNILVHTNTLLIVQTNAGEILTDLFVSKQKDKQNDSNTQSHYYSGSESACSATIFGSFNLGLHVNDDPKKVLANRALLLAQMNTYLSSVSPSIEPSQSQPQVDSIHWLNQIHSNQVVEIGHYDNLKTELSLIPPEADAMITDLPNTGLAIMTADCVPIVLHHQASGRIAAIHAGWQGLANGVIAKTYAQFCSEQTENETLLVATQDKPIQAWIGACISQSCYEVSLDVVERLLSGCENLGMSIEKVKQAIVRKHENPTKAWLNLPKLAELQLEKLGIRVMGYKDQKSSQSNVSPETSFSSSSADKSFIVQSDVQQSSNVSRASLAYGCSYSDKAYYSYRRMTHQGYKNTGRMALFIVRLQ